MTFSAIETSRQKGEPVTLYLFIYGGEEGDSPAPSHFAYTDAEKAQTHGGSEYDPVPIMRDNVAASGSLDKSTLSIRMPRDIPLSELFRVYPPTQVVTLIIRQGHLSDGDSQREFLVVWSGRVLSVGREDHECIVSCEPVSSSLRRPGLRRHYQIGCPHALYGPQCRADKAAATVTATVSAIDGLWVTLAAGWEGAFPPAKFTEGMFQWTNDEGGLEIRKILRVDGDDLLLGGMLRDLDVSASVEVILGCNHIQSEPGDGIGDCNELHDNIHNYGGCPWIPLKNPIGFSNQYY